MHFQLVAATGCKMRCNADKRGITHLKETVSFVGEELGLKVYAASPPHRIQRGGHDWNLHLNGNG